MSGAKNVFALVLVVFFAVGTAYGDFDWTAGEPPMSSIDPDSSPQGYGYPFEVYDATGEYSGGQVTVNIYTNYNPAYPPTGTWRDSYMTGNADEWQPGDLYIAYAPQGTTVWEPEKFFAVGVGDHGNVVDQAYSGTWQYTKQGHVYSVSDLNGFATGTYEGYDDHISDVVPPDPDSSSPAVPLPGDEALPSDVLSRNWDTDEGDSSIHMPTTIPIRHCCDLRRTTSTTGQQSPGTTTTRPMKATTN